MSELMDKESIKDIAADKGENPRSKYPVEVTVALASKCMELYQQLEEAGAQALGYAWSYACNLADKDIDIRYWKIPKLLEDYNNAIKKETTMSNPNYDLTAEPLASTESTPNMPPSDHRKVCRARMLIHHWRNLNLKGAALQAAQAFASSLEDALKDDKYGREGDHFMVPAYQDVLIERQRQVEVEGRTEAHDDEHDKHELAIAAMCYTNPHQSDNTLGIWPWHDGSYKPRSYRENLVRAGALIIAEIERLDRMENTNINREKAV